VRDVLSFLPPPLWLLPAAAALFIPAPGQSPAAKEEDFSTYKCVELCSRFVHSCLTRCFER